MNSSLTISKAHLIRPHAKHLEWHAGVPVSTYWWSCMEKSAVRALHHTLGRETALLMLVADDFAALRLALQTQSDCPGCCFVSRDLRFFFCLEQNQREGL